jgi:cytochrome c oxidase cbb3-type subunit 2/cytochrome c oxidase cbb3-type subunit I/II
MKMSFKIVLWGAIAVVLAVVTVVVFTPTAVWKPATTTIAHPYTPEQERGRALFLSNGCNYCHTQYVRAVDNAMGPVSQGGDYAYDQPLGLGSIRTGPDLSYIGRKRSQRWEIDHLKDPRKFSPMSVMPRFDFLADSDLRAISEYLYYLGDRNAAEFMIASPAPYETARPKEFTKATQNSGDNPEPQGWPTFKDSGLYEGKLIYASRCITCHGCAGNGLGTYGGTLIVTPVNFKADPFRTMPDDEWFWHVSEGVQGTVMPPWKESLTEEQRWNVVRYVQEVYAHAFERDPDEGDVPKEYDLKNPLEISIENIDAGKRIWTRECAVCHGDAAHGEGIYRQGIEPVPPDFSAHADYADFTDGAYFWRISEGVPWTAMPTWKEVYDPTERWQLVTYIRTMFTQTTPAPAQLADTDPKRFEMTATEKAATIPSTAKFDAGRQQFLVQCAHCHGLAGDGAGWFGDYLNPKPAKLQQVLAKGAPGVMDHYDGKTFAKVTHGIKDTAMPVWGEFLNSRARWADVKFLKVAFTEGTGSAGTTSPYGNGAVPLPYVRTDPGIFQDEIATVTPGDAKPLYERYCATCHGKDGKGGGSGTKRLASGSPAALPKGMSLPYIFGTIRAGTPGTMMYGFEPLLSETEIWDLTAYTVELTGGKWGE